ncbi:MAG: hypothetical protein WKF73_14355 [Nocardioidaceae bacterium]
MDAWVDADASLKDALSTMLQWDAGWVAVLDQDHFLGVLTPNTLHEALRRSVSAEEEGVPLEDGQRHVQRTRPLAQPADQSQGLPPATCLRLGGAGSAS